MKSSVLARKVAAFGASTAVLAAMVSGLMANPAAAATQSSTGAAAGKTAASASKSKPKVSVTAPKVSIGDYQGSCPVKVDFSAKIKVSVKGKTELAYRWLHGDGSKGKVRVIKLKGSKSVTVKQSVTFKGNVKGWEAVQVLGPRKVTSKKGYFSVTCGSDDVRTDKDPQVWAKAWANPDTYVGSCTPGDKIDFTGLIKVSQPTWVRYRWILNGDVVDGGRLKVWDTRKVGFGFSPRYSHRGWAQLEILGPWGNDSNRAHYKVWCKDEAPATQVSVSDLVPGADHNSCKVSAVAKISATGKGRVSWSFLVDGKVAGSGDTYFHEAGAKLVNLDAQAVADATKGGTVTISVTGPSNSASTSQTYVAPCPKAPSTPAATPTPTPSAADSTKE
ncbi:hypothetical protein OIE66_01630 [Nonomuraea sp. NBC_01738]|uniref:hypothetical protein n=1 Tax=Nonomuraea sp. NBC_01738 TaxID=2976003 RepID=UPI002E0D8952|nr:hypothetical protein OIE66_01630 [Nonomuraea sp. NBC_01738]